MSKKGIKACVKSELDELVWTDGNVYYYWHPISKAVECAITKHHDLSGEPEYVVFWNGFGIIRSRDLNTLKKDVEQLVRLRKKRGINHE